MTHDAPVQVWAHVEVEPAPQLLERPEDGVADVDGEADDIAVAAVVVEPIGRRPRACRADRDKRRYYVDE